MKLKKVCFLLSHGKWLAELVNLIEKLQACGIGCEVRLAEEGFEPVEEVLYFTDSAALAGLLKQEALPVLAFLHEENRGEDFSQIRYACEEAGELEPEYLERVYRRFAGLPWKILETERCILRESVEEDAEAFFKIYAEPSITRYTENLYENQASEQAYLREYRENMYEYYEFGIWTVLLKETGEIIGRAGLSVREGYELPELGYIIGVPWQGKGLAKEVCQGILRYAREEFGFDRIQALVQEENKASVGLAEALGFEEQSRIRDTDKNYVFFVRSE